MKKLRQEVIDSMPESGGISEIIDMGAMETLNLTRTELINLYESVTDEEMDLIADVITSPSNFSDKRKALEIRNKYLTLIP